MCSIKKYLEISLVILHINFSMVRPIWLQTIFQMAVFEEYYSCGLYFPFK